MNAPPGRDGRLEEAKPPPTASALRTLGHRSEGVVALERGRRFVGCELKRSYFEQACRNLTGAKATTGSLFDFAAAK